MHIPNHVFGALRGALLRSTVGRRLAVVQLGTLAVAILAILPASSSTAPVHLSATPAAAGPWLNRLNQWRAASGLLNATEDAALSQGDYNHALYMVKTASVAHSEDPASPYYTASGNTAAQNSNIFVSSSTSTSDQQAIDWWMGAPFHAMAMMDPRLVTTGFGSYRDSATSPWKMGAAVNVSSGMSSTGTYPLYFPGNLSTEPLTSYSGNESPSPTQTGACPGYSGLPLFIEVGPNASTTAGPAHTLTGNGTQLDNCVLDSNNAVVGSNLKWRGGVILMPRQPLVSGVTYTVALTVNATPYHWSFTVGAFVTSTTPCTSVTLAADKSSPQTPGTVVTFTATAVGCPNPEYLVYLQPPGGGWTVARSYGGPVWAWNTTGLLPGTYVVDIWVRDAGSGAAYQAIVLMNYTLATPGACANVTVSSDKISPQAVGTVVTFTAASSACSQPEYLYYLQAPGDVWRVARGYGGLAFVWSTSGLAVGAYKVDVWARQTGSPALYESVVIIDFSLSASGTACTAAGLSPDKASPHATGTIVTFTGTSATCPNPQYLFYIQPPGGSWTVVRDYGASTFVWNTAGLAAGSYKVDVWVRQSGSASSYEAFGLIDYVLGIPGAACTSAGLSADKASPQQSGTIVTLTATSATCLNPEYLFYVQAPGGSWTVVRGYGSPAFAWNTAGLAPGSYNLDVWVRRGASAASYEAFQVITYSLTNPTACAGAGLTPDKASPQVAGTTITFTVTSTGCSQPQYLFYLQPPGGSWTVVRAYGSPTFAWSTAGLARGIYKVDVWVRQNGSAASYESFTVINYTVS